MFIMWHVDEMMDVVVKTHGRRSNKIYNSEIKMI